MRKNSDRELHGELHFQYKAVHLPSFCYVKSKVSALQKKMSLKQEKTDKQIQSILGKLPLCDVTFTHTYQASIEMM